ncbi:hypothetical protein RGU11_17805 [Rossellomorea marisflavi]|uniref:hypothetical protein n=1 Tax=Rossellomorea marisflavi TaxID=189381 RepID=UPI00285331B2|nr:hypothetical protein [Rossellomorea marisflavi]MDR4938240.1 hypothetical protein [Rossellomorea marisflavi]
MGKEKLRVDRSTRLAFTITIFGGAWFLLKSFFGYWYKLFSSYTYTKTIINIESLISVVILSLIIAISITTLIYIFNELKTFQSFNNDYEREEAERIADEKFFKIYKNLKVCTWVFLFVIAIIAAISIFANKMNLVFLLIVIVVTIIIFLVIYRLRKSNIVKNFFKGVDTLEKKMNPFSFIVYIIILVLFLGITLSSISLHYNQLVLIQFNSENDNTTLDVVMQNIDRKALKITMKNDGAGKDEEIDLREGMVKKDLIEVYDDSTKNNYKVYLNQLMERETFSINLSDYVNEGTNTIEIYLKYSSSNENSQNIRIKNDIIKTESNIEFAKKNFKINP